MNITEKLFSEFPPVSAAEWDAKIREDLCGADYSKKLMRKTLDNITIKPFYTADDLADIQYLEQMPGLFPFVRSDKTENNKWEIRQDFKVTDIDAVLEKMHLAATRGATSVGLDLTSKGDLYYHDFRKLVAGLDLTSTELNFIVTDMAPQVFDFLLKALNELNIDPKTFRGSLGFDPLCYLAATGGFIYSEQDDMSEAAKLISAAKDEMPSFRVLAANSHIFSDSGASAVQELAFGLAIISDYLVHLTDEDTSAATVAKYMQWNLGTGSDYFMEIAKIRAARILFSALMSAFDPRSKETPVYIHSSTTRWNKTLYDPNVNMLRLTTEAMAAILGGCNSLLVRPFDSTYNESGDFSERLARNIQIILKEESYFDKVIDPAGGSYYIEAITDSLIKNAWELFLRIDEQGGFIKSFTSGFIREEIAKAANHRAEMVASRREVLLGTNQFPNMNESVNGCITEDIAFPQPAVNSSLLSDPIQQGRAAAEFEKLRLSTEQHKGPRPKVFMLTYGNLAMRLARSQFSSNFFACAGYDVVDNPGFKTVRDGIDAALQAKADIVVLCSSDDEYAHIAPEAAELFKGRAIVVVAGAPASMEELKQKGITEFIHIRSNVLETLRSFHSKLGIEIK